MTAVNVINICSTYYVTTRNDVVLPNGVNAADVVNVSIKFDTAYIDLKDGSQIEVELENDIEGSHDYKRPDDFEFKPMIIDQDELLQDSCSVVYA